MTTHGSYMDGIVPLPAIVLAEQEENHMVMVTIYPVVVEALGTEDLETALIVAEAPLD